MSANAILRPSSLPKIAICPAYQARGGEAGGPAFRGTLMDQAFRLTVAGEKLIRTPDGEYLEAHETGPGQRGEEVEALDVLPSRIAALSDKFPDYDPPDDGVEGTLWTIKRAKLFDDNIVTKESELWVDVPHIPSGGVADMLFPDIAEHGDMKTGQIRNYREQMAAYALGFMDRFFASKWRAHLLFCDQKQVVTHDFTYEEALGIVLGLRAAQQDPDRKATPNEYCSWCGLFETCHARRELATRTFAYTNLQERWDTIKDDPEELSAFLLAADALQDFIKEGKAAGVDIIGDGVEMPGWKRVNKQGNEYVDIEAIIARVNKAGLPVGEVLRTLLSSVTGTKARKLFEGTDIELPETVFQRARGSSYLSKKATPKKKTTKEKK